MTTPNYLGFVSRAAYLEAQRQQALEAAERCEHAGDMESAAAFRSHAANLLEQIRREQAHA